MAAEPAAGPDVPGARGARRYRRPWRDRQGRFSPARALCLLLLCLPGGLLLGAWVTGGLGVRPLDAAIDETGTWAIRLLLLVLAVTPARYVARQARLTGLRRMIGVAALAYASGHFALYALDQSFAVDRIALEIGRRFYLTIGFAALLVMTLLGATSTDGAIRWLGSWRWAGLHRLVFPALAVALLHQALQSKQAVTEPVLLAGFFVWLLGWRLLWRLRRDRALPLAALALVAGLATAALEAGWYAAATGVDASAVIGANVEPDLAPRPALWVLIAGVGAAFLSAVVERRWGRSQSIALRARS